jgi:putative ABC transport system permease protein
VLKTTLKGLLARKLRLLTTSLAVLLGVAFMSGTLVLTDTIGKTFDDLFADVNAGTDAYVRGAAVVESDFGDQRPRVESALVDVVGGVEGVEAAAGTIQGYTQIIDPDGEPVGDPGNGAPTYGGNWIAVEELNPFVLVDGAAPAAADEVVLDKASADDTGYAVGDRAQVLTLQGPQDVTVAGIARFGQVDSPAGASYVLFTDEAAQSLVAEEGRYDAVLAVAVAGVDEEELASRVDGALPAGTEVLTGAEITEETQSEIKEQLSFFNIFLLIFAVIALFVGSFIIYNTFSIVVAQRSREMALMRAIGASRRQVLGSILLEATVVGVIASVVGLLAGIGVAAGLKALLAGFGIDIPAGGIVLLPRTVVVALATGLLVSVASALAPARRASKVPPIAAMRDLALDTSGGSRARVVAGVVITVLGGAAIAAGLVGDAGISSVGIGAMLVFVGVAVLGPVIAGPVARVIGSPLPKLKGVAGTLARENAMRNPKRTSATAAALMIGVGLVGFITILASSTKASVDDVLSQTFTGDVVIDSGSFGFGGLPPALAQQVAELPGVEAASGIRFTPATIDGAEQTIFSADPDAVERIVDVGIVAGDLSELGADGIAVLDSKAEDEGIGLGDTVDVTFSGGDRQLEVRAIYTEQQLAGSWFVGQPVIETAVADQADLQVYVTLADGVAVSDALPAIEAVAATYPTAEVLDEAEYIESQSAQIDQILNLIYVLLALAILIALMGITNTLALSIFERTRELGLLRAVGMTRRQLRATVRWESVIIALFGTALGLLIGLFFGWALVRALADDGFTAFRVPVGQLAVVALIAALAGVVAAILPARRAARLDVLAAISSS